MFEDLAKLAQATIYAVERLLHSVTKTIKSWFGSTHVNVDGSARKIVFVEPMSSKKPIYSTKITTLADQGLAEQGFEQLRAHLVAQLDVAIDEGMKQVEAFREIEEGLAMEEEDAEMSSVVEYENEDDVADSLESEDLLQEIETLLFETRAMLCTYAAD